MPQGGKTQFTYFFDNENTVISQSPLLGLHHASNTTVATLFIFLLATPLLKLFSGIHAWKALCLISHQYYSPAMQAGCVNGPTRNSAVANLTLTRSKLCSTCNTFK
jgi:hypothetical protein